MENYLLVLQESLQKKLQVLKEINRLSNEQATLLKEDFSLEQLDGNMDAKATLIKELTLLDNGFETLFNRIKKELALQKDKYKDEIKAMQELIKDITSVSVEIQTVEARNKTQVEKRFKMEREDIHKKRVGSKAAYDYYKSMNKLGYIGAQFMDEKK